MAESINYANAAIGKEDVLQETAELPVIEPAKKLGVALVGLSEYSTTQLAPALRETHLCRLAGIVTDTPAKIEEWKTKYSIPDGNIYNYDNFDEIKSNPDIDIVYIVLPNSMHAEFVIRAAKAGKHVICEKPMAITESECDDMIAACEKAGKLLAIGYRLHYDPYHKEIMKEGQAKIFGQLKRIHLQHGRKDATGWRLNKSLAGGGCIMDLGIYCIQAARYITGEEPSAVNVLEHTMSGKGEDAVETFIKWEMTFSNGLVATCESSYTDDMDLLHVDAAHGWFELSPAYAYNDIVGKTATGFLHFPPVNQQALQMDDFALSILEQKPVKLPGELGKKDIQVIAAIYDSMALGKRVKIAHKSLKV
jgi:predicted dehydrogenase